MHTNHKKEHPVYIELLVLVLGTVLSAFALNMIILPVGILSGGITGISQFIHHFFPINMGVAYFLFNIPLMILGYIFLGKKFSIYTILSIILLSVSLYIIPVRSIWTSNVLLSAIYGGLLVSIGSGLVLRFGGSQGGIDILSRVIARYKNITVGKVNLCINVTIVIMSGFVFDSEIALYTIISMYVSMKTSEFILHHVNRITLLIITDKGDDVSAIITQQLKRGATSWEANGSYTHQEKTVLFCVIVEGELAQLKKLVKESDPKAFISIISTQNVIGRFNKGW